MAKEFGSFFGSVLGERIRSPLGEFGSPAAYMIGGRSQDSGRNRIIHDIMERYGDDHWDIRQTLPHNLWSHVAWGYLGQVHACTGHNGVPLGFITEHHRYDGPSDSWDMLQPINEPGRQFAVALQIGSRVHVCNGLQFENGQDRGLLNLHESYLEDDDSWVRKQDVIGDKRKFVSGFVIYDRAIVVGGQIMGTSENHNQQRTGDTSEYDPSTDSWSALQLLPPIGFLENGDPDWADDMGADVAATGTRGYVFLGREQITTHRNWVRHYTRADDTWTEDRDVPEQFGEQVFNSFVMSAVSLGGLIHLMGGGVRVDGDQGPRELYNLRLDHFADSWDTRHPMNPPARNDTNVVAP